MDLRLSAHAEVMLKERNIPEEWVRHTIEQPDWQEVENDDNSHYFKSIPEYDERVLHVVVNRGVSPPVVVTVFFDRGARRPE